jgi:Tol biopolymer transport system component
MRLLLTALLLALAPPAVAQTDAAAPPDTTWTVFEPGVISTPEGTETSPSITADGQTMVFARTAGWTDKGPYIATRQGDGWRVQKAPFTDTLYNLAVAPDGQSISSRRTRRRTAQR